MKPVDPSKGYQLDTSFIQEQHHTNPRRLYSQTGADWQYRVDHERLRRQRLERIRAEMEADDLGGGGGGIGIDEAFDERGEAVRDEATSPATRNSA